MNAVQMSLDMNASAASDRHARLRTHPVVQQSYTIPTPPLRRAFDVAASIVASGGPGASFAAFPRFGKTYAIDYIARALPEAFPTVPIVSFIGHQSKPPREKAFFADLYQQSGYAYVSDKKRSDMREKLVRAWWTLARSHDSKLLLFLGDEMQRLSNDELTWLIDATNDLWQHGIRVIGLFFGQSELVHVRSALQQCRRIDIIGRFMSHFYSFDGICTAAELADVMNAYDDSAVCSYPSGSGVSYSQFFFPSAYAHGWRLRSSAMVLWQCFVDVAQGGGSTKKSSSAGLSIGMQWVSRAIESVLVEHTEFDHPQFALMQDNWVRAVEHSGFASSLGLTYDLGRSATVYS